MFIWGLQLDLGGEKIMGLISPSHMDSITMYRMNTLLQFNRRDNHPLSAEKWEHSTLLIR